MANSYTVLAALRAGRCSNAAEVRLLRFWKPRTSTKWDNWSLLSRWINQCWPFTYLKNGSMVSLSCHKIPQPKSGTVLQPCLLGYPPQLRRLSILAAISQYNSATSNASTVSRPFTLPEK
ncbi:PREDICTED: uncharacterized protein LOC106332744 isoform X2 [Brassica oleracea var. oleracea]|uniref:uncharacterized protein LOC106332744 isoform X2 n=1 Tax=Brassica oleracea var. oleracea TaxID=109376 RepID=UPI0006A6D77B|nr:PREDICTED: uncharacterized protein LOC106332744 isoform X2 [Brassica oleracea var. oleracea]